MLRGVSLLNLVYEVLFSYFIGSSECDSTTVILTSLVTKIALLVLLLRLAKDAECMGDKIVTK